MNAADPLAGIGASSRGPLMNVSRMSRRKPRTTAEDVWVSQAASGSGTNSHVSCGSPRSSRRSTPWGSSRTPRTRANGTSSARRQPFSPGAPSHRNSRRFGSTTSVPPSGRVLSACASRTLKTPAASSTIQSGASRKGADAAAAATSAGRGETAASGVAARSEPIPHAAK